MTTTVNLVKCPSDILSKVMECLDDKTNTIFIRTCKELLQHGKTC